MSAPSAELSGLPIAPAATVPSDSLGVLLDLAMPGVDGYSGLASFRARFPA